MSDTEGTTVQEQATETKTKGKKTESNLILATASEVENLSKTKALNLAAHLADDIETNYFKLGGVLKVIYQNAWFEGYENFNLFVYEKFGFKGRKAEYLMKLYTDLVEKNIPWEKVSHLGWTKLKDLAPVLTLENLDEWVAKATPCTVVELQGMLQAKMATDGSTSPKTTDEVQVFKVKLKGDQMETVQSALASVKAQLQTEFDSVALENLAAAHLAGVSGSIQAPVKSLAEQFKELGYEKVLETFDQVFPEIDIDVKVPEA